MKALVLAGLVAAGGIGVAGAAEADHLGQDTGSGGAFERAVYAPGKTAQAENGHDLPWLQDEGSSERYGAARPASQVQVEPLAPTVTYSQGGAPYCREFHTSASIAGQMAELFGTACRRPDGTWEIVGPPSFRAQ